MDNILNLSKIKISNFRSIWETGWIDLNGPIKPVIGINGAGKSNILRAIDWFSNDEKKYEKSYLYNVYHKKKSVTTKVEMEYSISDLSAFSTIVRDLFNSFFQEYKKSSDIDLEEYVNEVEKQIAIIEKKRKLTIFKIKHSNEESIYSFSFKIGLQIDSVSDKTSLIFNLSKLIFSKIVVGAAPKVNFIDTSEVLAEFSKENNERKTTQQNNKIINTSMGFKHIFDWTSLVNKGNDKYIVIDSILKRTKSGFTFEDLINLSNNSQRSQSLFNRKSSDDLFALQAEFSDAVTKNTFFKSINSNSKFVIFPEYKAALLENSSEEGIRNMTNVYKLTLFDIFQTEAGEEGYELIKDIGFKNDGFIFALILFIQIDFLLKDNGVLLIDEPANFLSTNSIKLLMENFKRIFDERGIRFIFTTHSSYTLNKNIVSIEDILIAKKSPEFKTEIFDYFNSSEDWDENQIINEEYGIKMKGRELFRFNNEAEDFLVDNFIYETINPLEQEIIKFLNTVTDKNIIHCPSEKIIIKNIEKFNSTRTSQINYKIKNITKKINLLNLLDNYDIRMIVGEFEITDGGGVNDFKIENDPQYKEDLLWKIFNHGKINPTTLKSRLKESMKKINKIMEGL